MEWIRGVRCALVTYCNPCGQPSGVAVEALEEVAGLEVHWMGLTKIFLEMMVSGSSLTSSGACRQESASTLTFLGPGR